MPSWLRRALSGLALCLSLGLAAGGALAQQPVPELTARVIDQTVTLTPEQVAQMEARLAAFETEVGSQIVVLLVPSTQPEDIATYAQRVGDSWKIGRRDVGDGLLIVVAVDDRRINIQTTRTLEGAVPDILAGQIIARVIRPAFRAGDYAGGLNGALDQIEARIRGEDLPLPGGNSGSGSEAPFQDLLLFFFFAVPVVGSVMTRAMGRKLGSVVTAGGAGAMGWWLTASVLIGLGAAVVALVVVGLLGIGAAARSLSRGGRRGGPPIIFGSGGDHGGWGGGGGFGGGGGGFSSGGGGGFGGGGASGGW